MAMKRNRPECAYCHSHSVQVKMWIPTDITSQEIHDFMQHELDRMIRFVKEDGKKVTLWCSDCGQFTEVTASNFNLLIGSKDE